MAISVLPSQEYLRECFDYDPDTGILIWRVRPLHHFALDRDQTAFNNKFSHTPAGTREKAGTHDTISINGRRLLAHRIIWKWMTGEEPPAKLDHENRNPRDNRWTNLRIATHQQNMQNCKIKKTNRSGFKGVEYHQKSQKWCARIRTDAGRISLGYFTTPEAAHAAYCEAAKKHFGEFMSPG